MLGSKFADIEEKYDLQKGTEGFVEEGAEKENGEDDSVSETDAAEEEGGEIEY